MTIDWEMITPLSLYRIDKVSIPTDKDSITYKRYE